MKVSATKTMAHEINLNAKDRPFHAHVIELDGESLINLVGFSVARREPLNRNGLYNVIVITYAPDLYAMPNYVTTNDLRKIAAATKGEYEKFFKVLIDTLEI